VPFFSRYQANQEGISTQHYSNAVSHIKVSMGKLDCPGKDFLGESQLPSTCSVRQVAMCTSIRKSSIYKMEETTAWMVSLE